MVELNIQVPEGFLNEEKRCGFLVTRQRKEIWAVEIDLLMQLDRVCKKHGLKYCIGAGTLLGAVRHKGFIPWDDDIDVYMFRKDYDRLMELSGEFQSPYILQNAQTDKNMITWFSRLRNSQTTGSTVRETRADICRGIFIDIFPLDGISDDPKADEKQKKTDRRLKKMCQHYNAIRYREKYKSRFDEIKHKLIHGMVSVVLRDPVKLQNAYHKNLKKFSLDETELWGNRTLVFDCPKSRRPKKDYEDLTVMPFEFVEVPVPRAFDALLSQQYGDYMTIPENKGGTMHGELIISTDYAFDDPRRNQGQ